LKTPLKSGIRIALTGNKGKNGSGEVPGSIEKLPVEKKGVKVYY